MTATAVCIVGGGGSSQQFVVYNASKTTIVRNAYLRVDLSQSEMWTVHWHASLHILMYVWLTAGCVVYRWLSTHIVVSFCASVDLKT